MKKWLVTGGAGFIGSNLVHELLHRGDEVRVVDNLITGKLKNLEEIKNDIDFIKGDLREEDVCRRAVKDVEVILHQAALGSVPRSVADPATSNDHNVNATMNLLIAARQAGAFEGLTAVLLGRFLVRARSHFPPDRRLLDVLRESFLPLGVPVVRGLHVGHGPGKRALPLGQVARLDTQSARLEFGT